MFGIEFLSVTFFVGIAIGFALSWIMQNGWGKVLAIYHARAAKFDAEFQAHVAKSLPTALAPLAQDIERIKEKIGMASPPVV